MAEGPSDPLEATPKWCENASSLSVVERLSPALEVKSMVPMRKSPMRRQTEKDRKLKLRKDSGAHRYLNINQSKVSTGTSIASTQDCGQSTSKSPPTVQACKSVKKPSQATISNEFPELAGVRRKLSISLSPPLNSHRSSQDSELLPFYMQFMPPLEYLHRCMPVSYHLKTSPVTISDPLVISRIYQDLSTLPSSPVSYHQNKKEDAKHCTCESATRMQPPLSSSKGHPTMKTMKESSHKLLPVAYLAIKGIPKELNVASIHDRLPIIYSKKYNLRYFKAMKKYNFDQIMLPDKPARIYSILAVKLYKVMLDECVQWEALDITSIFDISKYIPDAIKKFDIVNVARIMKINFYEAIPNWDDFDAAMLYPLRVQMMGSVVACKLATDVGWAINIGGGFCHNSAQFGKGLAVYDDVLVCLTIVSKFPKMNQVLVINCDAYQSSNYKYVEDISCPVTILDFYSKPFHEPFINQPSHSPNDHVKYYGYLLDDRKGNHQLFKMWKIISGYLEDQSKPWPSLCIYIAGTNVLDPSDPVLFTTKNVITRDQIVFQTLHVIHDIPIAILLGGGYQKYDVEAAAVSIWQLCKTVHSKEKLKNRPKSTLVW